MRRKEKSDPVDVILLIAVGAWVVFLFLILGGCVRDERGELIRDSDECYKRDQRAVMLCSGTSGHCYIQCRDRTDQ